MKGKPQRGQEVRRSVLQRPGWGLPGASPRRDYQEPVMVLTGNCRRAGRLWEWECIDGRGVIDWVDSRRLEVIG